jgi:hypothetical protein
MDRVDQDRQDVERIMRRAAEMGHDPERVARALDQRPLAQIEYQPVMEFQRRPSFGARMARLVARRH